MLDSQRTMLSPTNEIKYEEEEFKRNQKSKDVWIYLNK